MHFTFTLKRHPTPLNNTVMQPECVCVCVYSSTNTWTPHNGAGRDVQYNSLVPPLALLPSPDKYIYITHKQQSGPQWQQRPVPTTASGLGVAGALPFVKVQPRVDSVPRNTSLHTNYRSILSSPPVSWLLSCI